MNWQVNKLIKYGFIILFLLFIYLPVYSETCYRILMLDSLTKKAIKDFQIFDITVEYSEIPLTRTGNCIYLDSSKVKTIAILSEDYSDKQIDLINLRLDDTIYLNPEIRYINSVVINKKVNKINMEVGRTNTVTKSYFGIGKNISISFVVNLHTLIDPVFIKSISLYCSENKSTIGVPVKMRIYFLNNNLPFVKNKYEITYNKDSFIGEYQYLLDSSNYWKYFNFPIIRTKAENRILLFEISGNGDSSVLQYQAYTDKIYCKCINHCACIVFNGRKSKYFPAASITEFNGYNFNTLLLSEEVAPRLKIALYTIKKGRLNVKRKGKK